MVLILNGRKVSAEDLVAAFYDLYGDEPVTNDGWKQFSAAELWRTFDADIQRDIKEYLKR